MANVLGNGEAVMTLGNAVNGFQIINQDHGGNNLNIGCACSRSSRLRRRASRRRCLTVAGDDPLVFEPRVRLAVQPQPPTPPARQINTFQMRFLFEKQLQKSDVSKAGRIVLPKKPAETYLPTLDVKEMLWMHLEDMDFHKVWTFKFRYWSNNRGRMYILENTKEFTKMYCLEMGDYIMVYKDDLAGLYLVRARKKSDYLPIHESTLADNGNFPATVEEFLHYGINNPKYTREEGTSDYAHLVRTPCCESLDFAPLQ